MPSAKPEMPFTRDRPVTNDDFGAQFAAAMKLVSSPGAAELRFRGLLQRALSENRIEDARICRGQLAICLEEQGRRRESLRILIHLARERASARSFGRLAYGLERYGWFVLAEHFFQRAMDLPEEGRAAVPWHEQARVGMERARALRHVRRR